MNTVPGCLTRRVEQIIYGFTEYLKKRRAPTWLDKLLKNALPMTRSSESNGHIEHSH